MGASIIVNFLSVVRGDEAVCGRDLAVGDGGRGGEMESRMPEIVS